MRLSAAKVVLKFQNNRPCTKTFMRNFISFQVLSCYSPSSPFAIISTLNTTDGKLKLFQLSEPILCCSAKKANLKKVLYIKFYFKKLKTPTLWVYMLVYTARKSAAARCPHTPRPPVALLWRTQLCVVLCVVCTVGGYECVACVTCSDWRLSCRWFVLCWVSATRA